MNGDGKAIGAGTVFRLLGRKPGIHLLERELFHLLGSHAPTALWCTAEQRQHPAASRGQA